MKTPEPPLAIARLRGATTIMQGAIRRNVPIGPDRVAVMALVAAALDAAIKEVEKARADAG
jgi:hypothetical protein